LLLQTEISSERLAAPSSTVQPKPEPSTLSASQIDGTNHGLIEALTVFTIRKPHRNLSQSSEGKGQSISDLNSNSSCYGLSRRKRRNETPGILFDASFSFFEEGFIIRKKGLGWGGERR
jgi:hypothetical protein